MAVNYSETFPGLGAGVIASQSLDRYYQELAAQNLTELPTPNTERERVERRQFADASNWGAVDRGFYERHTHDVTAAKIIGHYAKGLFNTHPSMANRVSPDYREAFWAGLEISGHDGRPVLPWPTGIRGRGELWQWGPRGTTDTLVAAQPEDGTYVFAVEKFHPVTRAGKLALMGGFIEVEKGEGVMDAHVRESFEESAETINLRRAEGVALTDGVPIANRSMTDNAWKTSHGALFVVGSEAMTAAGTSTDGELEDEVDTRFGWHRLDDRLYERLAKSPQRKVLLDAAIELELISVGEAA